MSEEIGRTAVRGVFWTGLGQLIRQLVQVFGSMVLARLLAPEDFGLLGMAFFFVGIGQLFADFGIGSAIIQTRSDDRIILSSCFWLNIGVAGTLALALLAASPLIADFYKRSDLAPLVAALSFNLVLAGLQAVPSALLYRTMRFADLARAQVLGSLAGAVVAITMAWLGAGVWSLVAQPLVGSAASLLVCLLALHWRPYFEFSWPKVAPLARFSFALLGTNLLGYANRNFDSLLVGKFLGAGPLGLYAMAIQLMVYPTQQVSSVIVRVLFPTLVQIRDDLPRLRGAYLRAVSGIALFTFPMMGGLFAVAHDFVLVVFGPNWTAMVAVIKVLAWVGMIQSVSTTVGAIYLSMGRPGIAFRVTAVGTPLLIGGMVSGLPWGILGVAIGYAVANFVLFFYVATRALRLVELKLSDFLGSIVRPLVATGLMVGIVWLVVVAAQEVQPIARLSISISTGIVAYLLICLAINRRQLKELIEILRSARSRGSR